MKDSTRRTEVTRKEIVMLFALGLYTTVLFLLLTQLSRSGFEAWAQRVLPQTEESKTS